MSESNIICEICGKAVDNTTTRQVCDNCHLCKHNRPRIEIDDQAIRFIYVGGQTNLFWDNLFSPRPNQNFQNEVMLNIRRLHDECVSNRE